MQENPYAAPTVDPHASAPQAPGQNGPRDWTIGHAIGVGWQAVKEKPLPLIGGFALVAIINQGISQIVQSVMGSGADAGADPMAAITGTLAAMPILVVVSIYFTIGQFRVALQAARGQDVQFATFFSGFDRLLPGIILMILLYIGLVIGFMLLIIPGIILSLGWAMTLPLLSDTKAGVMEIFSESWAAMKGQKGQVFIFYLACIGVAMLGILALIVGIFVALPVIMIAMAEVYMCITGRRTAEA
jgi:uncharacterized membrane protein